MMNKKNCILTSLWQGDFTKNSSIFRCRDLQLRLRERRWGLVPTFRLQGSRKKEKRNLLEFLRLLSCRLHGTYVEELNNREDDDITFFGEMPKLDLHGVEFTFSADSSTPKTR